jgi:hypothetical protein
MRSVTGDWAGSSHAPEAALLMVFTPCSRQCGSRQAAPGRGSCRGGRRVRRLHCAARSCGPSPNSLRLLRSASFKQAATSQFTNALRAGPQALRCSSPQKSPLPGTACRERNRVWSSAEEPTTFPQRRVRAGRSAPLRPSPDTDSPVDCLCLARGRATGPARPAQVRGTESWGRRACALQQLTRRRLFERSEPKVSEVSSTARPQDEYRSGVGRTRPTAEVKRVDLPGRAFATQTTAVSAAATGKTA